MEEHVELLCQYSVPAHEHNNQGKEQPKLGHVTVPASVHVGQVWGWTRLGQFILSTDRSEKQDGEQERPDQTTTPASSQ